MRDSALYPEEKRRGCREGELLRQHAHTDRRRVVCRHRRAMLTSNRHTVGVQTPMGICPFVNLQVRPRTALRSLTCAG